MVPEADAVVVDPVRDPVPRGVGLFTGWDLVGEGASLGNSGDVRPVMGQHGLQHVAGLGKIGGLGDDVDLVSLPSPGGPDVQPAVVGRGRDEGEGDVDGVALVAVLGGGIPEAHVLADVVGGQA